MLRSRYERELGELSHTAVMSSSKMFQPQGSSSVTYNSTFVTDEDPCGRNVLLLPLPATRKLVKFQFIGLCLLVCVKHACTHVVCVATPDSFTFSTCVYCRG